MGIDVGLSEVDRIEVVFEEVNNEDITVELVDNPVTIELETPPEIQVAVNEIYSDVNVILDHDKLINRNLNKQHTADTIQESTSKRFTSDTEINSKANQIDLTNHINDLNNPHETDISNLEGFPTIPTLTKFLRDDKTFAEIALKHSQLISPNEDSNVQHLTNAEKTQGALATGNITLDTVKKVADKVVEILDPIIIDTTIPVGTALFEVVNDKNGTPLSSLNIKCVEVWINGVGTTGYILSGGGVIINDINENYQVGTQMLNNMTILIGRYFSNYLKIDTTAHNLDAIVAYKARAQELAIFNSASVGAFNASSFDKINKISISLPTINSLTAPANIVIKKC